MGAGSVGYTASFLHVFHAKGFLMLYNLHIFTGYLLRNNKIMQAYNPT